MDTERIRLLSKEITAALKDNDKAFGAKATRWLDRYYGRTKEWEFNFGFPLIESALAALVAQEPQFTVHDRNEDGALVAPVYERLLEHYSEVLHLRAEFESIVEWALITGMGIAKMGYTLDDTTAMGESKESGASTVAQPWINELDSRRFFVDPYCNRPDLADARYCGDEIDVLLATLKRNRAYDPVQVYELKPDEIATSYPEIKYREEEGRISQLPPEYGLKKIHEMHLRNPESKLTEIITFAKGHPVPLREDTLDKELSGEFFYVPLQFFPIRSRFYPTSILERTAAIIGMISGALVRMRNSWDNAPRKGIFYRDMVVDAKKTLKTLTEGDDWEWIEGTGGGQGKVAETLSPTIITQDEMSFVNLMIDIFHRVTGMTYMQMGIGSSRTATESGLIQKSSDLRTNRRMSIAESFAAVIGSKLLKMLSYLKNEIPAREILGTDLWIKWNEYEERQSRREKTERDTDITVKMSAQVNPAVEFRRDKMVMLLKIIGDPNVQAFIARDDSVGEFGRKVCQKIIVDSGWTEKVTLTPSAQPAPAPGEGVEGAAL